MVVPALLSPCHPAVARCCQSAAQRYLACLRGPEIVSFCDVGWGKHSLSAVKLGTAVGCTSHAVPCRPAVGGVGPADPHPGRVAAAHPCPAPPQIHHPQNLRVPGECGSAGSCQGSRSTVRPRWSWLLQQATMQQATVHFRRFGNLTHCFTFSHVQTQHLPCVKAAGCLCLTCTAELPWSSTSA